MNTFRGKRIVHQFGVVEGSAKEGKFSIDQTEASRQAIQYLLNTEAVTEELLQRCKVFVEVSVNPLYQRSFTITLTEK